jgi:hypothetical protein
MTDAGFDNLMSYNDPEMIRKSIMGELGFGGYGK